MSNLLFYVKTPDAGGIGGIDEYTKLMLHMDGDQSDSQHVVTHNGNPQFSTAQSKFGGSSMLFDGTNDYLSTGASSDWNHVTGQFTIEVWCILDDARNYGTMVAYGGGAAGWNGTNGHQWAMLIYNDQLYYQYWTGSTQQNMGPVTVDLTSTMHHVAVVNDDTNYNLFLDGVSVASGAAITYSPITTPSMLTIGDTPSHDSQWKGYIDEVRISNVARWTEGFTPPTSAYTSDANTKLLLHMDGDASASAHIVTTNGDPQLNAATTKFDGSMYFNGNDVLTIPDSDDWTFGSGDLTIDFWVNFSSAAINQTIVSQIRAGSSSYLPNSSFHLYYGAGPALYFTLVSGSTEYNVLAQLWTPEVGVWYHFAYSRSGNDHRFFVDGVQLGNTTVNSNAFNNSSHELFVGCRLYTEVGNDNYFNGYIDELRISKGIARWTSNFTPEGPYTE